MYYVYSSQMIIFMLDVFNESQTFFSKSYSFSFFLPYPTINLSLSLFLFLSAPLSLYMYNNISTSLIFFTLLRVYIAYAPVAPVMYRVGGPRSWVMDDPASHSFRSIQ